MAPASTRESKIAEACCDSHASICWTTSSSVTAASAGRFADGELRVQSLESKVEVLRQVDKERDQREGDQQKRADHDQDSGADRSTGGLRATPAARSQSLVEGSERRDSDDGEQDGERDGRQVDRECDDEGAERDRDQHSPADGGQAASASWGPSRRNGTAAGCAGSCPSAILIAGRVRGVGHRSRWRSRLDSLTAAACARPFRCIRSPRPAPNMVGRTPRIPPRRAA